MFSYSMGISSRHSVDEVRRWVVELIGPDPKWPDDYIADARDGVLRCRVSEVDHPVTREVFDELLGMPATCSLSWSTDNKADPALYERARHDLPLRAAQVAVGLDAEAFLCFEMDRMMMRRVDGELLLYSWHRGWAELAEEALLPAPHILTDDPGRM